MDIKYIRAIIINVSVIILALLPAIILELGAFEPFHRGYFCSDDSIRYPFKKSTIPYGVVVFIGLGVPSFAILIIEYFRTRGSNYSTLEAKLLCLRIFMALLLGACITQSLTDIIKYSIGRLRPHFWSVCMPDNCQYEVLAPIYIVNSSCRGNDTSLLVQARLSFPSGHTSFAAYCMIFCALYMQIRCQWCLVQPVRFLCQFICVSLAVGVGVSRISDYKHHPTDVLAGFFLGSVIAIVAVLQNFCPMKSFNNIQGSCKCPENEEHADKPNCELATLT